MKRVGNRKESSFSKNSFFAETQNTGSKRGGDKMRIKSQVSGMEMEYEHVDEDEDYLAR